MSFNQNSLTWMQQQKLRQAIPMDAPAGTGDASDIIGGLYVPGGGNIVSGSFSATANTELAIAHGLGYTPTGFIVINNNNGGVIYASGTTWTDTEIYLKSTVASTVASIVVF